MEQYVKLFRESLENINMIERLQGIPEHKYDEVLYSDTFKQMFWKNCTITFEPDKFDIKVQRLRYEPLYQRFYKYAALLKRNPKKYDIHLVDDALEVNINKVPYTDMELIIKMLVKSV